MKLSTHSKERLLLHFYPGLFMYVYEYEDRKLSNLILNLNK